MNNILKTFGTVILLAAIFESCGNHSVKKIKEDSTDSAVVGLSINQIIDTSKFNAVVNGKQTRLFKLKNSTGIELGITNYGGRFVYLLAPDKNGQPVNVIIGMESVNAFKNATEPYFNATIGRYGNRIAKGKFFLDGKEYTLPKNNGQNTLHGGTKGFQYVVWDAVQPNDSTLQLSYVSPDMENGFPGNLTVHVVYSLTADNAVKMEYTAISDKNTVINLTNHAFFNLNGAGSGTILNHRLQIFANEYTPIDSTLIPTGKIETVKNTPFDFTLPNSIGKNINSNNEQLKFGKGYDHNFVLSGTKGLYNLVHAASVTGDKSGIILDVYTQEPGLQFYSGNFMLSKNVMLGGYKDDLRTAFCLETQHYPNSPNQSSFPTTELKAGVKYHTVSYYKFSH